MVDLGELGEKIRHLREAQGLSRDVLAARMGVSRETVRKYENGLAKRALRNKDTLTSIAKCLSKHDCTISVEDILYKL